MICTLYVKHVYMNNTTFTGGIGLVKELPQYKYVNLLINIHHDQ